MSARTRRRRDTANGEAVWAPLADTMTLVASVFLIVFLASLAAYQLASALAKKADRENRELRAALVDLQRRARTAQQALAGTGLGSQIEIGVDGSLRLDERVLFALGEAELKPDGRLLIQQVVTPRVARALAVQGQRILIAGHTDARPIRTGQFPSNWELSSRRATNVLRAILEADASIDRSRIYAAGFADTNLRTPEQPNADENRRVEIHVKPEVGALLARVQELGQAPP